MGYGNTAKDGSGTFYHNLCDSLGKLVVNNFCDTIIVSDDSADDSDKSFAVPANYVYEIINIFVTYVSTATAGDRQLEVSITDGTNVICDVRAGAVQAASLTRYYNFSSMVPELTSFRDTDNLTTIIPKIPLPAAYVLRVWDNNAVAAAADDMTVRLVIGRRQV